MWVREQEPSWPAEKKQSQDSEVLSDAQSGSSGSSDEDFGSEDGEEYSSDGEISDEYDSDTEWDEAKLEKANARKYWNH